jgi:(p)ppGpp synthase/HD superfamily hydrolase
MIEKAKNYAIECHNTTGHLYDGKPYEIHLQMVFDTAKKFIYLIPAEAQENVLAACWVHDVIEDCRQTYNDVKAKTNETIAELAYALTNEKGKTRKERANNKYYKDIRETPFATFIKVCDRIANYEYSKQQGSRMAELYEKEMSHFLNILYDAKYEYLFNYLMSIKFNKKI